jgi:bacterioferritin-associated ferredoxin
VIVCHCGVVDEQQVAAAIDAGARTVASVCRSTGAGRDCGVCVFSVKRLVCSHRPLSNAELVAMDGAAS